MPAGYSGTPLAKKLGIEPGAHVAVLGTPVEYGSLLGDRPEDVRFSAVVKSDTTIAHVFVTERSELASHLKKLRVKLEETVPVWVSWPKRASKVATDITEDTIREVALPMGYVDIKVCAVSDVWSGLKLVVRKELRGKQAGLKQ